MADQRHGDDPDASPRGAPALRVWLLGGCRVAVGGREVPAGAWRRRKAAALVTLLALTPGHRLHRDQVACLLWPDTEAGPAANNLHRSLHVVRRILQPDLAPRSSSSYLTLAGDTLRLGSSRCWVDADAFADLADVAAGGDDPALVDAALALYAGDLLPGYPYEEWTAAPRERLRARHLHLLLSMARWHEGRGDRAAVVATWQRAVVSEPTC